MLASALTLMAIVTQDQTVLRAAPRESATQQVVLYQGDSLEIRGEKGDYLQVYDHRHERAGYIRATQVRRQSLEAKDANELLSIVRFLRDTQGAEALGISYVAAFIRAAPATAIDAEIFDALGAMADRLAKRASSQQSKRMAEITQAHLEVVAALGVKMNSFAQDEQVKLCYDGEAHRRVLAMPANALQKANAALALTEHDCISPSLTPVERFALDNWRAEVLNRADTKNLPEVIKNRLHMRKAGIWASLSYQRARRAEFNADAVRAAGQTALEELAAVNKSELMESDNAAYSDTGVRVGASRWSVEATPVTHKGLAIRTRAGKTGETCVDLYDHNTHSDDSADKQIALATRCTYGVVWTASVSVSRDQRTVALAVQPLDTWRELWVFQKTAKTWEINVIPPGSDAPNLGYIEFAGWTPNNQEMLAAREIKKDRQYQQSFELLGLTNLDVLKKADKPASLSPFYRWQDPLWKARTVSLR